MNPLQILNRFLLLCLVAFHFPASIVSAAPAVQEAQATLILINESEATICSVFIADNTATEWGQEQLENELVKPSETHVFQISLGIYKLLLADCDGKMMLYREQLPLVAAVDFELRVRQADIANAECQFYENHATQLYNQGDYEDSLKAFQSAIVCYRQVGNLNREAITRNSMGFAYEGKGEYDNALKSYQQAAKIFRSIGSRIDEATSLENVAWVYAYQKKHEQALAGYEQALVIRQEIGDHAGEAKTLTEIGSINESQGRYQEALNNYQQALTITQEWGDHKRVSDLLVNVGSIYSIQGRYDEALKAYQQSLVIVRELNDHNGEAKVLANIGLVYETQGRYENALETYQQALLILQINEDQKTKGTLLNGIGVVYASQGRAEEALKTYHQALTINQEIGNRRGEAATLANISAVYESQGHYTEALEGFQQALTILRMEKDRRGESTLLNNIGAVYASQGRYREALGTYQQALAISRKLGERVLEGTTLVNIGSVYQNQSRYGEALETYQQALTILNRAGDQATESTVLNNIATVYRFQGQHEKALMNYEKGLAIKRKIGDRAGEGVILNNIGSLYESQASYQQALESLQEALVIRREVGDRMGESTTLANIGLVYERQGHYTDSLEILQQALAIVRSSGDRILEGEILTAIAGQHLSQGHYEEATRIYQEAMLIAHEMGNRTEEAIILNNVGFMSANQGQYEEAEASYLKAMEIFESIRAVAGNDTERSRFIDQYTSLFDRTLQLYLEQNQLVAAFETSERGRARAFLDSLATGQVELFDNAASDLLARENKAYVERQTAQDALTKAKTLNPPDSALVDDLEQQLTTAETDYAAALSAIQSRQDRLIDLVPGYNNNVLPINAVQAQLDNQTTLVSYWMLGDKTVAFMVTAHDFRVAELSDATVDRVHTTLDSLYQWQNPQNPYPRPLRNLYKWLVEPLADHLNTPHIAIIPHQVLHYVPFAALTDGEHYWGQQYTLTVLPSASVLPFLQQNAAQVKPTENPTALVFGNPQTDLPALPAAETEADAVAQLLNTAVYTGTAASERQLRRGVNDANILHLAAHGGYNTVNPLYSAIALAQGGDDDGLLETHEIFGLSLQSNALVILSACQTNVGQLSRGDEVVGLTRAFFFAGSPTIISSLWNVDDAATETLMVSFYKHWLQDGMSKAAALQAAQADVRADPSWVSPFYWAGFVLNGDGGASAPASASGTR